MADIHKLNPFAIGKNDLRLLAGDEDLEQFQIICHWKNGSTTVGWSAGITHSQLVFGSKCLEAEVHGRVFPHRHQADEIDY